MKIIEGFSVDLQTSLKTLAEQENLQQQIKTGFDEVLAHLDKQPDLDPKVTPPNATDWLVFSSSNIRFLGRKQELENLQEFLDCPKHFSWWMVTGSGGTGKSRLALELCLRNRTGWRCGFLPDTEFSSFDWAHWKPDQPTLRVIDYAAGRMEEVRKLIETLRRNQGDTLIRLLLLERVLDEKGERELFSTGSTRAAVKEVRYQEEWLAVPPFSRDDLWDLMQGVFKIEPLPDKEETLSTLTAIDPQGRPLFAALSADAMNEHGNIRQWSRRRLLEDVLEREEEKWWKPAGIGEHDKNLLALSTLTGGISINDENLQTLKDYLPDLDDYPQKKLQVLNKSREENFISPLEPDIIGEFFLLELLNPKNKKSRKRLNAFLGFAWALQPQRMFMFLDLMGQDYIDHTTLSSFFPAPSIANRKTLLFWGMLSVNIIGYYGNKGEIKQALLFYETLAKLVTAYPEDLNLTILQTSAAGNIVGYYSKTNQIEKALQYYEVLNRIAKIYPDNLPLSLLIAMRVVNLTHYYANLGKTQHIIPLYKTLEHLAKNHPNEPALASQQSLGGNNLIAAFCISNQVEQALPIYQTVVQLSDSYPHDSELRLKQANAANHLNKYYGDSGQVERAFTYYKILKKLADDHPGEPKLRVNLAKGAVHTMAGFAEVGDVMRTLPLL